MVHSYVSDEVKAGRLKGPFTLTEATAVHISPVGIVQSVIRQWGPSTLLAKLDLKAAYYMVSVHPTDHHLLGIIWDEAVYVDTALPFGLRSSPKIFIAVADGLAWAMMCNGVRELLHYLDDCLVFGTAGAKEANLTLTCALETCCCLGFQVAPEKFHLPRISRH